MTAPDWLTQRGGTLKLGSDGTTWYILFAGQPNYSLRAIPVEGKHGCTIRQTINGARITSAGIFATTDEAVRGGLGDYGKRSDGEAKAGRAASRAAPAASAP